MKKILLIGDSPVNDSPYIQSYIEVYERNGIAYDLLFWNRHLDSTEELPDNNIPIILVFCTHYEAIKVCTLVMDLQEHPKDFETIVSVVRQFRGRRLAA